MIEGWDYKTLFSVCEIDKSQGHHKELPYVGMEDMESHTGRFLGTPEPQTVKSTTFKFDDEHVLYGRLRPYLNKVLVPDFSGHCSTEVFPLKPSLALDRRFLFYWLIMSTTVEQINRTCTGARMPRANMKEVMNFQIPLPPLPEQKRIVAILDEAFAGIDATVANTKNNLANARELFESYLNSVFTQKGDGWVETTIGEQITLQRGFDITKKQQKPGNVPVVSSGGIKSHHDTAMATGPGVVLGRKGTIGKVHFVQEDYWPHDTTLWVKDFNENLPKLAYYLFKGLNLARFDSGAANPALNRNIVHPIKISWPEPSLQLEIIDLLDRVQTEAERLEAIYQQKLEILAELKQSILQKAFAGELTTLPVKIRKEATV